jgi:hypothetical protein
LTGLGRGSLSSVATKHEVKRADRLLGNDGLFADHGKVLEWLVKTLVGSASEIWVAVDWTPVEPETQVHALYAALIHCGRALPLLFEVHGDGMKDSTAIEEAFLARIRETIPAHTRVVIIADAGFRGPFFLAADALGLGVVCRMAGYVCVEH